MQRGEQMRFVHCYAAKATLPEMAGTLLTRVHASGKGTLNLRHGASQGIDMLGEPGQMDVIGHQHPAPHRRSIYPTMLGQEIAISGIVRVAEEGLSPPVNTLRCVMRNTRQSDASKAGHLGTMVEIMDEVNLVHCYRNSYRILQIYVMSQCSRLVLRLLCSPR